MAPRIAVATAPIGRSTSHTGTDAFTSTEPMTHAVTYAPKA
jgi:hypothetical protein